MFCVKHQAKKKKKKKNDFLQDVESWVVGSVLCISATLGLAFVA